MTSRLQLGSLHHQQIPAHLRDAILGGRLEAGAKLPSTRALASELGVSRRTVLVVYDQLIAEGYIVGEGGSGARVAALTAPTWTLQKYALRYDFNYGIPALESFPRDVWRRLFSNCVNRASTLGFAYGAPEGYPRCERRSRGTCRPRAPSSATPHASLSWAAPSRRST